MTNIRKFVGQLYQREDSNLKHYCPQYIKEWNFLLNIAIGVKQPRRPRATVAIAALTEDGVHGHGKSSGYNFFIPFCRKLRLEGLATVFCRNPEELASTIRGNTPTIVINVYGEDHRRIDTPEVLNILEGAAEVFNGAAVGPIIARKDATHELLTRHGVRMPNRAVQGKRIFSGAVAGTREPTSVLEADEAIDDARYNTELIDTEVEYGGSRFYTTLRLLCVNERIVHANATARPVSEGCPNVHASDTPLDPGLIEYLQKVLFQDHQAEHEKAAQRIFEALGPGFYAHDMLVCNKTGDVYVCETGFKFENTGYSDLIAKIQEHLPSHQILFPPENFSQIMAEAFINACISRAVFQ